METNESILTREAVIIEDRKKLGKLKALRVNPDTRAVSQYIIGSAATAAELVLPFEKALAVGDTFLTIQNNDSILSTESPEAARVLKDGYRLLDAEVYSRTGNLLGSVKGFEFDPVFGTITTILLKDAVTAVSSFAADTFVFFSPEFVFVDDGAPTAGDLRTDDSDAAPAEVATFVPAVEPAPTPEPEPAPTPEPEPEPVVEETLAISFEAETVAETPAPAAEAPAAPETPAPAAPEPAAVLLAPETPATEADDLVDTATFPAVEAAPAPEPEPAPAPASEENALDDVSAFLVGSTINDDVVSADGLFRADSGTVLTAELVAQAKEHDALLLLAMNVDA